MNTTTYCSCSECGEIFPSHLASNPSCPMCTHKVEIATRSSARMTLVVLAGVVASLFTVAAAVAGPIFK